LKYEKILDTQDGNAKNNSRCKVVAIPPILKVWRCYSDFRMNTFKK